MFFYITKARIKHIHSEQSVQTIYSYSAITLIDMKTLQDVSIALKVKWDIQLGVF